MNVNQHAKTELRLFDVLPGQFLRDASMIVLVAQDQDADLWCAPGSELVRLEDRLL